MGLQIKFERPDSLLVNTAIQSAVVLFFFPPKEKAFVTLQLEKMQFSGAGALGHHLNSLRFFSSDCAAPSNLQKFLKLMVLKVLERLITPSFLFDESTILWVYGLLSVPVLNLFFPVAFLRPFHSCFPFGAGHMAHLHTVYIIFPLDNLDCFIHRWDGCTFWSSWGKNFLTAQYFVEKRWLITYITLFSDTKPHFQISYGLCKTVSYYIVISQLQWLMKVVFCLFPTLFKKEKK